MDPAYAEKYATFEEKHWWFRARRLILKRLLTTEIQWSPEMNVLEIGVGPGLNLYSLYPPCRLQGMEPDVENAGLAARRGAIPVSVGTIEEMPVQLRDEKFDVITMFDVLEHIRDDRGALSLVRSRLKASGTLVLTVPAFQWLWSGHDVVNQHFRRYTRSELLERLRGAGFKIQRATYFNSLLFPPIALARLAGRLLRRGNQPPKSDFEHGSGPIDSILFKVFSAESAWLARRSLPFGVSLFAVARNDAPSL